MKTHKLILYLVLITLLQSCCSFQTDCGDDIIIEPRMSMYEPIILERSEFENSIRISAPIAIESSGKIYIKENLLLINEVYKGFHIYNNTDPSLPTAMHFIEAPGSTDVAIRDNILYINQATDLIAVEYTTSTSQISVTKRIVNMFPELRSPDGFLPYGIPDNSIVVGWKLINQN